MSETEEPKKSYKLTTIIVISVTLIIIVAAIVSSIVIALVLGNKGPTSTLHYFKGSFRITNLVYSQEYSKSSSSEYISLSSDSERILKTTFENSILKSYYSLSKVISFSPGSVIPEFVIQFDVPKADGETYSAASVQKVFTDNLKMHSRSQYDIDGSSLQLSEITVTAAEDLLYSECGVGGPSVTSRIVGGTPADDNSWPWQASLRLEGRQRCGASLISNTWLVTAAHCFNVNSNVNMWTVVLGTLSSNPGVGLRIQRIIIHERYDDLRQQNDIALLQLSDPVNFKKNIRTVCLPKSSDVFADDSSCYITGWGALEFEGVTSPILRQAEVKIINTDLCRSSNVLGDLIGPSVMCAGYMNGKIDACSGDSGGPLVTKRNDDKWSLIGITSFGEGCATPNKPGGYSRVTYLRSWITEKSGL